MLLIELLKIVLSFAAIGLDHLATLATSIPGIDEEEIGAVLDQGGVGDGGREIRQARPGHGGEVEGVDGVEEDGSRVSA